MLIRRSLAAAPVRRCGWMVQRGDAAEGPPLSAALQPLGLLFELRDEPVEPFAGK
jgi:hypothetical protein